MTDERATVRHALPGLLTLSVAVGVALTTELLPVGLLPEIATGLGVPEARAGSLVSLYAVMVAALSVPLTLLTRSIPRKPLLLGTLVAYAVGNLGVAVAPTYLAVAGARVVGGLSHALFFSICIGYTARLVPASLAGRAMAVVSVGVSGGVVLGAPLGTALGVATGWRVPFAVLAGVTGLVLVLGAVTLPPVSTAGTPDGGHPGRRADLAVVTGANGLTYLGQYVLYTYLSVLLLRSGAAPGAVGPLLLGLGASGLLGLRVAASALDARPRSSAVVVPATMALAVVVIASGYPGLALVLAAAALWSAAFGASPPLYQSAAVRTAAVSPDVAGAWINASANAGIAAGAALGGLVLDGPGMRAVVWTSGAVLALSAVFALPARRAFGPGAVGPQTSG